MNLKTTVVLLVLVAVGTAFYLLGPTLAPQLGLAPRASSTTGQKTLAVLQEITPKDLTRIEIQRGEHTIVFERSPGGAWTMPGNWPTRKPEVEQLVGALTGLQTRFAPIAIDDSNLKKLGLDTPAIIVRVRLEGGRDHRLAFGQEMGQKDDPTADSNPFTRPTYVRVDDEPEMVRLPPGLIPALDRPADYYQQRRLFPSERVVKDSGGVGEVQEKVDSLLAKNITVKEKKEGGKSYSLTRIDDDWTLQEPVSDLADPDKVKSILRAVPDIWAEQFVDKPKKELSEYDLQDPEQIITVTNPNGDVISLLVGKQSQMKTRTIMRPAPPFGPPMPPQRDVVHEEYRYAKLQGNDQIFEIKADGLKEVFVGLDVLRDARLARFRPEDARKVEITFDGAEIVLAKEKERWRLQKPMEADAESSKVTELLDKLSGLQAKDKDILDKADPKAQGLDKPAGTIKVAVEEEIKAADGTKSKKTKSFTLALGKHDTEKAKLAVRREGWDRINIVEDSLLPLVKRPALAYRGRRVFDFLASDLSKVEVQRADERLVLELNKGTWRLTAPAPADADREKARQLGDNLAQLEAVEHVNDAPKPEDLEGQYGLAKPALSAVMTFSDESKPAQTLLIGKQRGMQPEYFAKLAAAPGVFVVKKDIRDALDQSSLAYRPLQLWSVPAEDISAVRIQKSDQEEYRLTRNDKGWRISGPFDADAMPTITLSLVEELTDARCERYEAQAAKDGATYGLDKPHLRLTLEPAMKKKDDKPDGASAKDEKEPAKERVLIVGKATDKDPKSHYAKLGDSDAVFVVGPKLLSAVDHAALDLLDRRLLSLDINAVERIRSVRSDGVLALQRQDKDWSVVESPAATFPADENIVAGALGVWSRLQAERFAAYGPKADLAKFGLDKPALTVTVSVQKPDGDGKKPEDHTLTVGEIVKDGAAGARYAQLDNGPGIVVLAPTVVSELMHTYLDFVKRDLLKFEAGSVTAVERHMGADNLELAKRDDGWYLTKPVEQRADDKTLQELMEQLSAARARRIAAYPIKDLKAFGLDEPAAVLKLRLAGVDGKPAEQVLKIGKAADETGDDRFVLAEGSQAVGVLPGALGRRLLAGPIAFRDRNLARFADADRIILERGPRSATFTKIEGTWKLTEVPQAETEQTGLEDLINSLARLRADELVADKPTDLKPYGLERPEVHWRFQSGDKDVLNLLIGRREKIQKDGKDADGSRCYAKLANESLVFLLDSQLTTRVLGEYRGRTVWTPSLDAAQIDVLEYKRGGNTFSLLKEGNNWRLAGRPDAVIKPEAVSEALAALAGLKVERYVVDKGADMKLYGLEPPELVIEAKTPTGKRTLHIGRPEGESKRVYAHLPDKDRSEVFIISEADAGKIVRVAFTPSK